MTQPTKQDVQKAIVDALAARFSGQGITTHDKKRRPTKVALVEQAAFLGGAGAALQAAFPREDGLLTDYFAPSWFIAVIRGELITDERSA